jgi:hypothetical protein
MKKKKDEGMEQYTPDGRIDEFLKTKLDVEAIKERVYAEEERQRLVREQLLKGKTRRGWRQLYPSAKEWASEELLLEKEYPFALADCEGLSLGNLPFTAVYRLFDIYRLENGR